MSDPISPSIPPSPDSPTLARRTVPGITRLLAPAGRAVRRIKWAPKSASVRRVLWCIGWVLLVLVTFCIAYALLVVRGR